VPNRSFYLSITRFRRRCATIETATPGSQVVLDADGSVPLRGPDKGIYSEQLTVNRLTFERARTPAGGNGAGIRDQSAGNTPLTVENSIFKGNQDGILTETASVTVFGEKITIKNSLFFNNGNPSVQTQTQDSPCRLGRA
jgi:hypothetical protein